MSLNSGNRISNDFGDHELGKFSFVGAQGGMRLASYGSFREAHERRHERSAALVAPFRVRLRPSLAGIELLKDGGVLTAELDPEAQQPARFHFHRLRADPDSWPRSEYGRTVSCPSPNFGFAFKENVNATL